MIISHSRKILKYFFIVKMAECDEKLAVHGLNVSHIGLAVKTNGLERVTRSCQSSKKKRRDFFCISFENSQFTVILQTFLSGWGPLPSLPKRQITQNVSL